jgi:hypothetical protein
MKKYLLFLVILLSLHSQAFAESQRWKTSDIVGYNLKLSDPIEYQSFSFGPADEHLVAASFGRVGGPITFPLLYWKIDRNGILHIKCYDGKIMFRLKKLGQKDGMIQVEMSKDRDGSFPKQVEYKRTKPLPAK